MILEICIVSLFLTIKKAIAKLCDKFIFSKMLNC